MSEDTRESYPCVCPVCSSEFRACKSIAQEIGILDAGSGKCPKCKTFLNLTFHEKDKKMVLTPWDKYMEGRDKVE